MVQLIPIVYYAAKVKFSFKNYLDPHKQKDLIQRKKTFPLNQGKHKLEKEQGLFPVIIFKAGIISQVQMVSQR